MKEKIRDWLSQFFGIDVLKKSVTSELARLSILEKELIHKLNKLEESTKIDVEVGHRGDCTIILTGVYKNRGYVEFYDIPHRDFAYYVEDLKARRKGNLIRHIDGAIGFNFKGWFDLK